MGRKVAKLFAGKRAAIVRTPPPKVRTKPPAGFGRAQAPNTLYKRTGQRAVGKPPRPLGGYVSDVRTVVPFRSNFSPY